jgi:membrane associated rhomboid family serine protease
MFPIRDTVRSRSFAFINWMIIIVNVLVFFYESNLPLNAMNRFVQMWALVPARVQLENPVTWYPFFSHIWLHGSLFHLLSNMWMLVILGDNVEDRLGSMRYLVFYVLGGISAGVVQYYFTANETIPALGASGAIAAVMGAYLLFYPRSRVITFVPVFLFGWFVEIPSVLFLGVWFITQLFSGLATLGMPAGMGGVAWWAHIGGFLFGLLLAKPFCIGKCARRQYVDEYFPW